MDPFAWVASGSLLAPFLVGKAVEFAQWREIVPVLAFSLFLFWLTDRLVPTVKTLLSSANLALPDPNKQFLTYVPTALGLLPAVLYLFVLLVLGYFANSPQNHCLYVAVGVSVCFTTLLGFACDVLELGRPYKQLLPCIAVIPVLAATASTPPLTAKFAVLCVLPAFCGNALSLSGGLNALKVGQAFVVSCAVLTMSFLDAVLSPRAPEPLLCFNLTAPLVFSVYALLKHNKYPSSVFAGDTFSFFCGMALAAISIVGQFPKTLVLFFAPQIVSMAVFLPQLFGFYQQLGGKKVRLAGGTARDTSVKNGLASVYLQWYGPLDEEQLVTHLVVLQIAVCSAVLLLRYNTAGLL